jgi:hypothetical protein
MLKKSPRMASGEYSQERRCERLLSKDANISEDSSASIVDSFGAFANPDSKPSGADKSSTDTPEKTVSLCLFTTKPGKHDVVLGRGGGTFERPNPNFRVISAFIHVRFFVHAGPNKHAGNVAFRKLVSIHKMQYMAASKVDKPKVARKVVLKWKQLSPPGRFLARLEGKGSTKCSHWYEVDDKKAREKTSQCLREISSNVQPVIHALYVPTIETHPFSLSSTLHPQGAILWLGFPHKANGIGSRARRHSSPLHESLPSHPISPCTRRNSLRTSLCSGLKPTDIGRLTDQQYQHQLSMMQQSLMEERQRLQRLQHVMLQAQQQLAGNHVDHPVLTPPSHPNSDTLAAAWDSDSPSPCQPKRRRQDEDDPDYLLRNEHFRDFKQDQTHQEWKKQPVEAHGTDSSTANNPIKISESPVPIHYQQENADNSLQIEPDQCVGLSVSEPLHPLKRRLEVSNGSYDNTLSEKIDPAQLNFMHNEENELGGLKYRQQLEAYIRDTKEMAPDNNYFELKDDWEKELELAVENENQLQVPELDGHGNNCLESYTACHSKSSLLDLSDVLTVQLPAIQMFKSRSARSILSLSSDFTNLPDVSEQRETDL